MQSCPSQVGSRTDHTMAPRALFRSCTVIAVTLKTKPLQNVKGDSPVVLSRWRTTRRNLFYYKNIQLQCLSATRSQEEDPGYNCKPAACRRVYSPFLQSRPLLQGEGIQNNTGQGLTQNSTPFTTQQWFPLLEVFFSQKSHPPSSSNTVPLYRFCLYRPCTGCHSSTSQMRNS